jgi:hypothetical protein
MGVPLFRALCPPVEFDNGRVVPFLGAHTAQNLVKARQRFMKDLVEPYRASLTTPGEWERRHQLRAAIGDTSLTIHPRDYRMPGAASIQVFAPTISSVRGDGLLHLGFDEVLVFTNARGQELMAAARPTLAQMRGHGQLWRGSNVTRMNGPTTWLYQLREKGRQRIADGVTQGAAYFEFTIPDDADPADENNWWRYYPGLSDGLVRIDELRADFAPEGLGLANAAAEYLGRWPGALSVSTWAAIAEADWTRQRTENPMPDRLPAVLGVEIDPFGRSASIAAAVHDEAGDLVEIIDHRPGDAWVPDRLREVAGRVEAVAVDDYGPGRDLLATLAEDPALAHKLVPLRGPDVVAACYGFEAGLRDGSLEWVASDYHAALSAAAQAAERTPGRSWQFERRVSVSQSALMAAVLARWVAAHRPVTPDSEIF